MVGICMVGKCKVGNVVKMNAKRSETTAEEPTNSLERDATNIYQQLNELSGFAVAYAFV